MDHGISYVQNTAASYAAVCEDCPRWMGGDGTREEAERDARMHEEGERHPWNPAGVEAWSPEGQPE